MWVTHRRAWCPFQRCSLEATHLQRNTVVLHTFYINNSGKIHLILNQSNESITCMGSERTFPTDFNRFSTYWETAAASCKAFSLYLMKNNQWQHTHTSNHTQLDQRSFSLYFLQTFRQSRQPQSPLTYFEGWWISESLRSYLGWFPVQVDFHYLHCEQTP